MKNQNHLEKLTLDALQEYYALKFYKVYKEMPKAKHLEKDKTQLIKKINILSLLEGV